MLRPYQCGEPLALDLPPRLHPRPHLLRRLAQALVGQFLVSHLRHYDVDVDAIQKRAGYMLLVLRHGARRAGARHLLVLSQRKEVNPNPS